jgi:hypothetical protein
MSNCKRCGSYAINPRLHGREADQDVGLCDVCYWRKRAEEAEKRVAELGTGIERAVEKIMRLRNAHEPHGDSNLTKTIAIIRAECGEE